MSSDRPHVFVIERRVKREGPWLPWNVYYKGEWTQAMLDDCVESKRKWFADDDWQWRMYRP